MGDVDRPKETGGVFESVYDVEAEVFEDYEGYPIAPGMMYDVGLVLDMEQVLLEEEIETEKGG